VPPAGADSVLGELVARVPGFGPIDIPTRSPTRCCPRVTGTPADRQIAAT